MTIHFESSGYVKDDDAKDWNADDLLKSYREGTEEANKGRTKMGVPALEILGWAEKPAYDAATHRLVWAMSSKGAARRPPMAGASTLQHLCTGPRGLLQSESGDRPRRSAQAQDACIDDAVLTRIRQRQALR